MLLLLQFRKSFQQPFLDVIPDILESTTPEIRNRILHIISVWSERKVYNQEYLNQLQNYLSTGKNQLLSPSSLQISISSASKATIPKSVLWIIQSIREIKKEIMACELHSENIRIYEVMLDRILQSSDAKDGEETMELSLNIKDAIQNVNIYKDNLKNEMIKYTELLNKIEEYENGIKEDIVCDESEIKKNEEHMKTIKRKLEIVESVSKRSRI